MTVLLTACGYRTPMLRLAILVLSILAMPGRAVAWGDEGHQIVGLIAEHYLTPVARAKARQLLAGDISGLAKSRSLADEATWADKYRDSDRNTTKVRYLQTNEWHFVDIELDAPDLAAACFQFPPLPPGTPASVGPPHDCIVDKINEFSRELAGGRTSAAERLAALQFLLHFVGDVHQPLHASDHHDRGGNDVHVTLDGTHPSNLHASWDTAYVARLGTQRETVASQLIAEITPAERRAWSRSSAAAWARQTYSLGKSHAYGKLPAADAQGVHDLDDAYARDAVAVIRLQLKRAGVRLATLLNRTLR